MRSVAVRLAIITGSLVSIGAPTASSAEWSQPIVGVMGQFTDADEVRCSEDADLGLSLSVLKPLNNHWAVELMFGGTTFDAAFTGGPEFEEQQFSLNALYGWGKYSGFQPYVNAGIGGVQTDFVTTGQSGSDTALEFGLGFFRQMHRSGLGFRVDARHRTMFIDEPVDTLNEWRFGLGLMMALGDAPKTKNTAVRRIPKPARRGVNPAAPVPPVRSQRPPLADSDEDGVPDVKDQCPTSERGLPVNDVGCVTDGDKDGVPDFYDACPSTLPGVKVDRIGCPISTVPSYSAAPLAPPVQFVDEPAAFVPSESYVLLDVHFGTGSSLVTNYSKKILDNNLPKIRQILADDSAVTIELGGHTDVVGKVQSNDSLSQRRATAVSDYLVSKGLDRARLETNGYGDQVPTHSNDNAEGRLMNRRVELVVHRNVR